MKNKLFRLVQWYCLATLFYRAFLTPEDTSLRALVPMYQFFQAHNEWLASLVIIPAALIYYKLKNIYSLLCRKKESQFVLRDEIVLFIISLGAISVSMFYELKLVPAGVIICSIYILIWIAEWTVMKSRTDVIKGGTNG